MYLQRGDIILTHSHNFTARVIQLGMNIERWLKLDFSPFWKKIYNHAAICLGDELIAEALPKGITIRTFSEAYLNSKDHDYIVYRIFLSNKESNLLCFIATRYKGVRYQFMNFLQFIPKIFFGVWLGKTHKKADDLLYCTEYVALVLNGATDNKLFKEYWKTDPNEVQNWCESNATKICEYNFKK